MSCAVADAAPPSAIKVRVAAISVFFTVVPFLLFENRGNPVRREHRKARDRG